LYRQQHAGRYNESTFRIWSTSANPTPVCRLILIHVGAVDWADLISRDTIALRGLWCCSTFCIDSCPMGSFRTYVFLFFVRWCHVVARPCRANSVTSSVAVRTILPIRTSPVIGPSWVQERSLGSICVCFVVSREVYEGATRGSPLKRAVQVRVMAEGYPALKGAGLLPPSAGRPLKRPECVLNAWELLSLIVYHRRRRVGKSFKYWRISRFCVPGRTPFGRSLARGEADLEGTQYRDQPSRRMGRSNIFQPCWLVVVVHHERRAPCPRLRGHDCTGMKDMVTLRVNHGTQRSAATGRWGPKEYPDPGRVEQGRRAVVHR